MSKLVYICFKDASKCNADLGKKMETIAERITPDNIVPRSPKIVLDGNIGYCIINPASSIQENGKSVLLGMAYGDHDKWWEPEGTIPDGSYSIFRSDNEKTEILTDAVASRSVWYYHDEEVFIASSSQRAIVMILGSFEFNKKVIPWVLSTGSLGPELSWDIRIKLMPADSVIALDYRSWRVGLRSNEVIFSSEDVSDREHELRLTRKLAETFKSLKIDFSKWVLPLSGGYDSRGILSLFNHIGENLKMVRAVTWGLKSSQAQPGNDAYVAKKLADHYKISHNYYLTDVSEEPIEKVFNRFLVCGEGRIDHIGGYIDGFKIWKTLFEDGIQGIVRGDEGMGKESVSSSLDVRKLIGITLCSDFSNLSQLSHIENFQNDFSEKLRKNENETLETWRDRVYHQFRMPTILPAFNDLKLCYVEVVNPLFSRRIVSYARRLPDHLRTNKSLFKKVVNSLNPKIPYATSDATASTRFLLKASSAVSIMRLEIDSEHCRSLMTKEFTTYLLENVRVVDEHIDVKQNVKSYLKRFLPKSVTSKAAGIVQRKSLDVNILVFRTYIICRMVKKLEDDANVFNSKMVLN